MKLNEEIVFSYLEEDNVQRAYFRVKPLLTLHGDIQEEASSLWPDESALRIVPDKDEQHTFKERMRSLGRYCVLDLRSFPLEANKIRTNKNYHPDRGECNQYIVFSDAIKALPCHTFYQVLTGEPSQYAALAEAAITPCFFVRNRDVFYGPVSKLQPAKPQPAEEMQATLFELCCPDQQIRTILCRAGDEADGDAAPKQTQASDSETEVAEHSGASAPVSSEGGDAEIPIGETLRILDESKSFDETLDHLDQPLSNDANLLNQKQYEELRASVPNRSQQEKLEGTPLYRSSIYSVTQHPKNRVQQAVAGQCRVMRNEPPAGPLPEGAELREIENPLVQATTLLQKAWSMVNARPQLIDSILALDGMPSALEKRQIGTKCSSSPLQQAMNKHLYDLESERLSELIQLDRAKADVSAFRQELLQELTGKKKREIERLDQSLEEHKAALTALKEDINHMIAEREQLIDSLEELDKPDIPDLVRCLLEKNHILLRSDDRPLRLTSICGFEATPDEMISRIEHACNAFGIQCRRNTAIAALSLIAICPRIGIYSDAPAASITLMSELAGVLGWKDGFGIQIDPAQRPLLSPPTADHTPLILVTTLNGRAPLDGVCKLMLTDNREAMASEVAYQADPWPIFPMRGLCSILEENQVSDSPVNSASLQKMALQSPCKEEDITSIMQPLLELVPALSGSAYREMVHFISSAAGYMDGGLPAACDWALLLWLVPRLSIHHDDLDEISEKLSEFPIASAYMTKNQSTKQR